MKLQKVLSCTLVAVLAVGTCVAFTACNTSEENPTVSSISVDASDAKTQYVVGDVFDSAGLKVTATMSDKTTSTVALADCTFSGFDSSTAVEAQEITVTYSAKTAKYTVSIAAEEFVEKTYTGKAVSVTDSSGATQAQVDATLKLISANTCEFTCPAAGFTPTFICTYTMDGAKITLIECTDARPVAAFSAAFGGVITKSFILGEDGTMTADPAVTIPGGEEEKPEQPGGGEENPEQPGGEEQPDDPVANLAANTMYFNYTFSMMNNPISDFFKATAATWYSKLNQASYTPVDTAENEILFTFTGTWLKIDVYTNGKYQLSAMDTSNPQMTYIKDSGTWSWTNYQFKLTRTSDAENPITASIKR